MCLVTCPTGYYNDNTTFVCGDCQTFCTACFGPSISQCTACNSSAGYVLADTTCQKLNCVDGEYEEQATQECLPCHETCKTCTDGTANGCLTCPVERILEGTSCVECSDLTGFLNPENVGDPCIEECGDGLNMGQF